MTTDHKDHQEHQDEKKDDSKISVTFLFRNGHTGKSMLSKKFQASTVQDLKTKAVELLSPTTLQEDLNETHIWIFLKETTKVTMDIGQLDHCFKISPVTDADGHQLNENGTYIAMEVFLVCPKNIFER